MNAGRNGWPLLAALCMVLLVVAGCSAEKVVPIQAGEMAPDFTMTTMSGQEVTLSQLKGQKVFLNFWTSWCPPCKREMPALQAMSRKYEDRVKLYGVNITADDTRQNAVDMVGSLALTFPHLLDVDGSVKKSYQIINYPVSMTIDEEGRIVERVNGELSEAKMEEMFRTLLQEKKP